MTWKYGCNPGGEEFAVNHAQDRFAIFGLGGSAEGYGSKLPTFTLEPVNENIKL
jgi:hypothetical protein